jgi:hypothetical protein
MTMGLPTPRIAYVGGDSMGRLTLANRASKHHAYSGNIRNQKLAISKHSLEAVLCDSKQTAVLYSKKDDENTFFIIKNRVKTVQ